MIHLAIIIRLTFLLPSLWKEKLFGDDLMTTNTHSCLSLTLLVLVYLVTVSKLKMQSVYSEAINLMCTTDLQSTCAVSGIKFTKYCRAWIVYNNYLGMKFFSIDLFP